MENLAQDQIESGIELEEHLSKVILDVQKSLNLPYSKWNEVDPRILVNTIWKEYNKKNMVELDFESDLQPEKPKSSPLVFQEGREYHGWKNGRLMYMGTDCYFGEFTYKFKRLNLNDYVHLKEEQLEAEFTSLS